MRGGVGGWGVVLLGLIGKVEFMVGKLCFFTRIWLGVMGAVESYLWLGEY